MKFDSLKAISFIAFIFRLDPVSAQGPPPPPPPLPIDGGILGLVIAALFMAVYEIRKSAKK